MTIITKILATLVALEFLYIMYLETIATTSEKTSKVFGMDKEEPERKSVNTLFKVWFLVREIPDQPDAGRRKGDKRTAESDQRKCQYSLVPS